ncbi:MAG: dihydrolipoamide acetyltransferase family protein [Bryobacteraceae bacterium]
MQHNIILPDLGQTTSEAKIVQWLKKPGEHISRGEPIVAVETDKVDMEVEAFQSGYLRQVLVAEGAMATALAPVAILTDTLAEDYDPPGAAKADAPFAAAFPGAERQVNVPRGRVNAAPAARILAREMEVDLARIEGTGPGGLITRADVRRAGEATLKSVGMPGLDRARAAMAATVTNSKREIPHFYAVRDLDMEAAGAWRDRWNQSGNGPHVSLNDVFVRCSALALGEVPGLNVAYRDGAFVQRMTADVLLVVAREPALLLVPVTDPRALDWKELIPRLREKTPAGNSLSAAPLFAISNLGMYGIKEFAAIIPPGCTSVLAIGAVREIPVVRKGAIGIGKVATVTLSADHRVVDGICAARFLERVQFHLNSL